MTRLALAALALALALGLGARAPSAAEDIPERDALDELLARFAAMPGLEARFREERQLELLSEPLVSEGRLAFAPPDQLLREVESPEPSSLLLRGRELVLTRAGETRSLDLDAQPAAGVLVESFRGVLGGKRDALEALYRVQMEGDPAGEWALQLTPRPRRLARRIRAVRLRGRAERVAALVIEEVRGDETRTQFFDIDPERHFSSEEREQLFQAPGP